TDTDRGTRTHCCGAGRPVGHDHAGPRTPEQAASPARREERQRWRSIVSWFAPLEELDALARHSVQLGRLIVMRLVAVPLTIGLLLVGAHARTLAERPRATVPAIGAHALSMYGDLKYGPNFKHFGYANPRAPKGGQARLAAVGTFD